MNVSDELDELEKQGAIDRTFDRFDRVCQALEERFPDARKAEQFSQTAAMLTLATTIQHEGLRSLADLSRSAENIDLALNAIANSQ